MLYSGKKLKVKWRSLYYCITLILVILLSIGCNPPEEQSPSLTGIDATCQTIDHIAGKTELCGEVKTIAVLSPPLLDIILSLGVQPSAYAEVELLGHPLFDHPAHQIPYLGNRVSTQPVNLGDRLNPSIETLLKLKPDLILGEEYQKTTYQSLSRIAPTILFEVQGSEGWQVAIQKLSKILDKEEQGNQIIRTYQSQIDSTKRHLSPKLTGQTILVLGWNRISNQSFIFEPDDFICEIVEKLGFQVIVGKPGRPDLSIEALSQIPTDYILVMPSGDNTIENAEKQWENDPVLRSIPAVEAGRIYFMDYQLTRIRGPIAAEIFIHQFQANILK